MTRALVRAVALAALVLALASPCAASASAATPPPDVSAPSALVVEASTGDVAYDKAPNRRRAIASATKLMTALLTLERSPALDGLPRRPLPRAARRVEDRPARRASG